MDQPPLESLPVIGSDQEDSGLPYFTASEALVAGASAFVVVVSNPLEFCQWLNHPGKEVQWIEVNHLLKEPEVWATAARKSNDVPLDVVVDDPETEYSFLYRLVDVRNVRDVRVTIPVQRGFLKALRLAASIQLPVRLLVGQPSDEIINELREAIEFYLHDPLVDAPIEFFHSFLSTRLENPAGNLWISMERDPSIFRRFDEQAAMAQPNVASSDFVTTHVANLKKEKAECENCRWLEYCLGYFKVPDPSYSCEGVKSLFDQIDAAAVEMKANLDQYSDRLAAPSKTGGTNS